MDFNSVVKKRVSIKKFSSKKPAPEKVVELIETANLAPTPGNIHIITYVMTDDKEKINEIAEACQQDFIKHAPYVLVVCSNNKQLKKLYDKRAEKYLKHHVGAAMENLLLAAVNNNLGASVVGLFSEELIRNTLSIPENIEIEMIIPIGYELLPGKSLPVAKKPALTNRLFFNGWGDKFYKGITKVRRVDY